MKNEKNHIITSCNSMLVPLKIQYYIFIFFQKGKNIILLSKIEKNIAVKILKA